MAEELKTTAMIRDEEERQRHIVVNLLRAVFLTLLSVVVAVSFVDESSEGEMYIRLRDWWWMPAIGAGLFFVLVVALDVLTPRRKLSTISAILFGSFAGLVATALIGFVIDYFSDIYFRTDENQEFVEQVSLLIKVVLGLGLAYLGSATILQTQDDFRLVIPYVEFAKQIRGPKPLLLDTSAIIDGRILDVAEVGLIQVPLIVPRFVIDELQSLSDSGDRLRRARGRRGLDIVGKLQKNPRLDVTIDEASVPGKDVDQMLVELAKAMPATIVTTDVGLNRVASIQGVSALNVHDLANALKPNVIPGEPLRVNLIKPGEQPGQGVGYLEDGTMVVAENGADAIGNEVSLTVTSTMQTSAGRLIFGRLQTTEGAGSTSDEEQEAGSDEVRQERGRGPRRTRR